MLHLPRVTLVAIDTAHHALTELAIAATLARASFGAVLLFSDRPLLAPGRAAFVDHTGRPIPTLPCPARTRTEAEAFMWSGVTPHLTTSHALYIQWDGWLTRPDLWTDQFLDYDWIGACWPWFATMNVGNGGFSLRSRRLLAVLNAAQPVIRFELPEDVTVCRRYRRVLELLFQLRWPAVALARQFAHEHEPGPAFGFHGAWNMVRALDEPALLHRLDLFNPAQLGNVQMVHLCALAQQAGYRAALARACALMASVAPGTRQAAVKCDSQP